MIKQQLLRQQYKAIPTIIAPTNIRAVRTTKQQQNNNNSTTNNNKTTTTITTTTKKSNYRNCQAIRAKATARLGCERRSENRERFKVKSEPTNV